MVDIEIAAANSEWSGESFLCGVSAAASSGSVRTKLSFNANAENEKAGIVIFQNESHFYYMCKGVDGGRPVVQLYQSDKDTMKLVESVLLKSIGDKLYMEVDPDNTVYRFTYSVNVKKWNSLKELDARFLSTATAGGFVGVVIGLYTTSLGKENAATAAFDWFEYKSE